MLVDIIENAKKELEELIEKGKLEAIKNFLEFGDSVEKIAKALKLPIEKVQKIKNELKT